MIKIVLRTNIFVFVVYSHLKFKYFKFGSQCEIIPMKLVGDLSSCKPKDTSRKYRIVWRQPEMSFITFRSRLLLIFISGICAGNRRWRRISGRDVMNSRRDVSKKSYRVKRTTTDSSPSLCPRRLIKFLILQNQDGYGLLPNNRWPESRRTLFASPIFFIKVDIHRAAERIEQTVSEIRTIGFIWLAIFS